MTLPNPQCLFCVHTELAYYQKYREAGKPVNVPKEGCAAVYESFKTEFDWVGTTETLTEETFKVVEHVGNVRYYPLTKNKSHDKIVKTNLKPQTVEYVRNITQYDLDMYNQARIDFPISMWSNLETTVMRPKPLPDHITHLHMKKFDKPDLLGQEERKRARAERKKRQQQIKDGTYQGGDEAEVKPKKKKKKKKKDQQQQSEGRRQFPSDHALPWNTAH